MSLNAAPPGSPLRNKLLAALRDPEWKRLRPNLELMDLSLGEILCESDSRLTHAYFPNTAIISLVCMMSDGTSSEIAAIGNKGLVGITLFMGCAATMNRMVVQCAGRAYRLRAESAAHADRTDRRLQSAPYDRAAIVPLAAVVPRSS